MNFPIYELRHEELVDCECDSCNYLMSKKGHFRRFFLLGFLFPPAWIVVLFLFANFLHKNKKGYREPHKKLQAQAFDTFIYTVCSAITYAAMAAIFVLWLQNRDMDVRMPSESK